jgi:hypothetical protein
LFYLFLISAGGDGPLSRKGSLLHLVDRSATAAVNDLMQLPCVALLHFSVFAGGDGPLSRKGSLLHLVDRSATAAGGRLLRRWLAAPLADRSLIADRQDAVQVRVSVAGGF